MEDTSNQATIEAPDSYGYDIAVSCCLEDGTDGERPDCDAYPKTYDEAVQICTDNGYRLCTKQELESGITVGEGCNFDYRYNWASDECGTPFVLI